MSNKEVALTERETAFNRILRFMNEGDITLTADEEQILHRWNYCYKLQLQRKYTSRHIAEKIKAVYDVSIYTANNDVYNAQALFGGSIKTNKKFLLHHHAENILLLIEQYKTDKALVHLIPKLLDSYTKAIVAIPDEINKDKTPPPVMLFAIIPGQSVSMTEDVQSAISRLKKSNKKDYTDFEELPNE